MRKTVVFIVLLLAIVPFIPLIQVRAETYKVGTVTIGEQSPALLSSGGTAKYVVTIKRGSGVGSVTGTFDVNLTLNTANTTLPQGATVSFSPQTIYFRSKDTYKTATVTIENLPAGAAAGEYSFTIRVTRNDAPYDYRCGDGELVFDNAPTLDRPLEVPTIRVNTPLSFTVTATDPDSEDSLSFSWYGTFPTGASLDSSGLFTWTPTLSQLHDSYSITIRVTDSYGLFDEESITLYVNGNVLIGDTSVVLNQNVGLQFEGSVTREGLALLDSSEDNIIFNWAPLADLVGEYYNITVTAGFNGMVQVTIQLPEGTETTGLVIAVNHGYDFNADGVVDVKDQTLLTNAINNNGPGGIDRFDTIYDLNRDGQLNNADLRILKAHLGETAWVDLPTSINGLILSAETSQFSGFGVH